MPGATRTRPADPRAARTALLLGQLRRRLDAAPPLGPGAEDLAGLEADHAVVVAPHPDDEVIGCGGLIHRLARRGTRVTVVFVTREGPASIVRRGEGEAAKPRRAREARAAAAVLGVHDMEFLGVDELAASRDPEAHRALEARLGRLLAGLEPDLLLVPQFHEMHPDHRAVCTAALGAVSSAGADAFARLGRVLLYEVWGACRADAFLDVPPASAAVLARALECYRSQLETVDYHAVMRLLRETRGGGAAGEGRLAEAYRSLAGREGARGYLRTVSNRSEPCC